MHNNEVLRRELLAMIAEDESLREELAADGSLFEGYHPRMKEVHRRNAARLKRMIEEHGWPARSLVGEDGAKAAWIIVQHAIGDPELQRRGLRLIKEAAEGGEAPLWQAAMLEDRICMFEGRPQLYGTQYDWDENGEMSPLALEDPAGVDARRLRAGLPPLAENTECMRAEVARSKERPPLDYAKRQKEMDDWARSAGWRK
ncbi:MAG: hypothetical protein L0229_10445 [Blastocatellia bacterium]|nr:hypothetical protein [Blastocatellia bacterium]